MNTKFSADFFKGNRARLRELFAGTAPIVIAANGLLQRSQDTAYPFTQDKDFWYLTGCNEPDAVLVIDRTSEYLILPPRSNYQDIFDGQVDNKLLTEQSGIGSIASHQDGWRQLNNRLKRVKHVATIAPPPRFSEIYGLHTNPARANLVRSIKLENKAIELLDIRAQLTRLRSIKQPQEIAAIKAAIAITSRSIKQVTKATKLKKYKYEYEIEADLTRAFRMSDSNHAFEPIIASGGRACILHNLDLSGEIKPTELIQFDVGAEVNGYAADLSRAFSVNQQPSKRQLAIHEAVLDVQSYALTLLKPGILLGDYEEQVEHYMGEKLRELNLIKTINHGNVRKYFPHATSHFLGLDVHDVGKYDAVLEVGMVLTCEPGIYVPEESVGVRIEDDVLITKSGNQILSQELPGRLC